VYVYLYEYTRTFLNIDTHTHTHTHTQGANRGARRRSSAQGTDILESTLYGDFLHPKKNLQEKSPRKKGGLTTLFPQKNSPRKKGGSLALMFSKVRSMETFFEKKKLQEKSPRKKGGTDVLKSTLYGDFFPQKNLQKKGGQRH
jgi:hypothetical protein